MTKKQQIQTQCSQFYSYLTMKQIKQKKLFKMKGGNEPQSKDPISTQDAIKIDEQIYAKFAKFMDQCRWQNLKARINQFYGRNFAIKYQHHYKFKEQWEDYLKEQEKPFMDFIHDQNFIIRLIYLFLMLSNTFVVWAISVLRVFRPKMCLDDLGEITSAMVLVGRACSILLRIYSKCRLSEMLTAKVLIKAIFWDSLIVVYFALAYLQPFYISQILMFFELLIWFFLFLQAKKIYKQVKLLTVSLLYQTKLKIADLMITSLIVTHFGSLILFAASWNNNGNSWIVSAGIDNADYFTQYLYSFYFCSTTILTIGYGDMSPKNVQQVLVVTLIEFVGVIIFAYIINEIGHTMSLMRQTQEDLQKDIKTLKRIEKCYKIDQVLAKKVKNYLTHHQCVVDHLTSQEESRLIGKLNEDLSSQIIFEKSLSVIKTSIFFLCRWTKDMQNNVANHIQKVLLAPKEKLVQPAGNQRIYIVKLGKIDIFIDRFGHSKKDYRRFLKSIQRTQNSEIGSNIYGYTTVISTNPCALDAVASDFTTCYFVNKQNFLKCVNRCDLDKQYYHEIKTKLDLSQFCQAYEAPSILNIRQHYNPSKTILIRKHSLKLQKLCNKRSYFLRNERKFSQANFEKQCDMKKAIQDKLVLITGDLQQETLVLQIDEKNSTEKRQKRRFDYEEEEEQEPQKQLTCFVKPMIDMIMGFSKTQFAKKFERCKEYVNYFPYSNLEEVLNCLGRENYNFKQKHNQNSSKSRSQSKNKSKKD